MSTRYADQTQLLTLVDVEDLEDWKTSMREESWQFSLAGFFASGSLWLGIDRYATYGLSDRLFLICAAVLVFSAIIGYFGYKQLGRRQLKIERYIKKAMADNAAKSGGTL
jgi:uncharacterized membrane protein YdcZ (DUF606 family)